MNWIRNVPSWPDRKNSNWYLNWRNTTGLTRTRENTLGTWTARNLKQKKQEMTGFQCVPRTHPGLANADDSTNTICSVLAWTRISDLSASVPRSMESKTACFVCEVVNCEYKMPWCRQAPHVLWDFAHISSRTVLPFRWLSAHMRFRVACEMNAFGVRAFWWGLFCFIFSLPTQQTFGNFGSKFTPNFFLSYSILEQFSTVLQFFLWKHTMQKKVGTP